MQECFKCFTVKILDYYNITVHLLVCNKLLLRQCRSFCHFCNVSICSLQSLQLRYVSYILYFFTFAFLGTTTLDINSFLSFRPTVYFGNFSEYYSYKVCNIEKLCINTWGGPVMFNHLTPNDHYMGRTAQLTSRCCILYIYSTNIRTEYFKHAA